MANAMQRGHGVKAHDHGEMVRQAELVISTVLRGGVLLSAAIIAVGVVMFYVRYFAMGAGAAAAHFPASLSEVGVGLAQGNPLAVVSLGLLVLLATPVLRVAVSIVAFALEGDRQYVVITLIVLVVLLGSFFFLGPALNLLSKR